MKQCQPVMTMQSGILQMSDFFLAVEFNCWRVCPSLGHGSMWGVNVYEWGTTPRTLKGCF